MSDHPKCEWCGGPDGQGHPAYCSPCSDRYHKRVCMLLWCPSCSERHIDEGTFATKPHHTHACQSCGLVWRPAIVDTVGVRFLRGFKDVPK